MPASSAPEPGLGTTGAASDPPRGDGRLRRAAFVDRDGTLVVDRHYMSSPDQVELHQGVADGIALLRAHQFPVVVVTNQSGIARGLYTVENVEAIHARIQELLGRHSTRIDAFYYCPHAPADGCACRKPGTGLFERAAQDLALDLPACSVLGDRWLDVEAGQRLGLLTAFVPEPGARVEYAEERARAAREADVYAPSFLSAVHRILARG